MIEIEKITIESVVVCDDIRKEITNKDILIGVYAGDIGVQMFPASVTVAFWLEVAAKQIGEQDLALKVMIGETQIGELNVHLHITNIGYLSVAVPGLTVPVMSETVIGLHVKKSGKWHPLKTKKIHKA